MCYTLRYTCTHEQQILGLSAQKCKHSIGFIRAAVMALSFSSLSLLSLSSLLSSLLSLFSSLLFSSLLFSSLLFSSLLFSSLHFSSLLFSSLLISSLLFSSLLISSLLFSSLLFSSLSLSLPPTPQRTWMVEMMSSNQSAYWYYMGLIYAQFEGLVIRHVMASL